MGEYTRRQNEVFAEGYGQITQSWWSVFRGPGIVFALGLGVIILIHYLRG